MRVQDAPIYPWKGTVSVRTRAYRNNGSVNLKIKRERAPLREGKGEGGGKK